MGAQMKVVLLYQELGDKSTTESQGQGAIAGKTFYSEKQRERDRTVGNSCCTHTIKNNGDGSAIASAEMETPSTAPYQVSLF